jgi:acetyl esterase/lipase
MHQGRWVSLRARLARLGLRWFVKRRSHHQELSAARRSFRSMERLIPPPPDGTRTTPIDAGGVNAEWVETPASRADRQLLYLHGGGYRLGSASTYRHFTWRIATETCARVLFLDYRLAPEHPFPAALEDALSAYCWLVNREAGTCLIMGDSSGGGLALGLLLKLRDDRLPLPAAAIVLSPWTDLALTGISLELNAASDPMLNADDLPHIAADYLAGVDPRNPYASPLYGNPSGFPPTLFQVGSDEILRDDSVRMVDAMRRAGCRAELQVWRKMPHAWQLLAPVLPEARLALADIGDFVERVVQKKENATA